MADDALIYPKPKTVQGTPGLHEEMIYSKKEIKNSYHNTTDLTIEDYAIFDEDVDVLFGQLVCHVRKKVRMADFTFQESGLIKHS